MTRSKHEPKKTGMQSHKCKHCGMDGEGRLIIVSKWFGFRKKQYHVHRECAKEFINSNA